jgi:amino acid permease
MIQAGYSYQGTEVVGIAAGETADPHNSVPKAIRQTFWPLRQDGNDSNTFHLVLIAIICLMCITSTR